MSDVQCPEDTAEHRTSNIERSTSKDAVEGHRSTGRPVWLFVAGVSLAFGAIARIHSSQDGLTPQQRARLEAFVRRYTTRTKKSKAYTEANRAMLADPPILYEDGLYLVPRVIE